MLLRNTYIGAWLSLIRIQSTPVTVLSLLIGYVSVTNTILTSHILPLILVGVLGHWGVYGHNDYVDRYEDKDAEKYHKPIPRGDINSNTAAIGISILIGGSIITAFWYFSIIPLVLYLFAVVIGIFYNYVSKDTLYSPHLLGLWGVVVILLGAMYAGSPSAFTWPLAALIGLHMFWMTIEGNLKDIGKGEISLPEEYDCHIYEEDEEEHLFVTYRMAAIIHFLILIHFILFLLFPIIAIVSNFSNIISITTLLYIIHLIITFFLADRVWYTVYQIIDQHPFDRDEIKRDIAKHTVIVVVTTLFISVLFTDVQSLIILILGSVVWGLGWQLIMYGDPFYFP